MQPTYPSNIQILQGGVTKKVVCGHAHLRSLVITRAYDWTQPTYALIHCVTMPVASSPA